MKQNEEQFNLSEFAKQARMQVYEAERKYNEKWGITDADPETDRDPAEPVGRTDG